MTVRLFRSNESGAPQLSSTTPGDLLTILRACLVEGFGSRTPAGWTMPFSDLPNKKACFKSVSGDTLRLDDSLDYRWAAVTGFKTMTSLNVGTEEYPNLDQLGAGNHYRVSKRYDSTGTSGAWMVIASDNWFYFIGMQNDASFNYPSGFYFGEYDCLNPSFTENYILTGYKSTLASVTTTSTYTSLYSSSEWFARRNYQNALLPTGLFFQLDLTSYLNPNPFTGSLELTKTPLRDNNSPFVKYGYLANHFRVCGSTRMGYKGGELFEIDTKKYAVIAYNSSAYAIEYDQDAA